MSGIANFGTWSPSQKIRRFAWYLRMHEQRERFDQAAIRTACHALHVEPPGDVGDVFAQMMRKRPPTILRDGRGYRREGRTRAALTSKYGKPESVVAVDRMLADLLGQISDAGERVFVAEAITCYRHHACRAAIAMTWNVPFDHLVTWIFADAARLAAFNASIPVRLGVKRWAGFVVYTRDDLEELTESKVI